MRRFWALAAVALALAPVAAAGDDADETDAPSVGEPTASDSTPEDDSAPSADPLEDAASDADSTQEGLKWGGIGLPLIGANAVDGFGFGLGGEIFTRRRSDTFGYLLKLTASGYVNVRFDYATATVRIEHRGPTTAFGILGFRTWKNMLYAGRGGAEVLVDHGPSERGNRLTSPFLFAGASRAIDGSPLALFGQAYARYVSTSAGADTLLEADSPYGLGGGVYADLTFGTTYSTVDRWPVPRSGWLNELSLRGGFSASGGRVEPLVGGALVLRRWTPILGDRLVIACRLLVDKTFGQRPFFEQEISGDQWRNELGLEKALTGYGRTRTRGDGVVAGLVELRSFLGQTRHDFFDFAFYLTAYAEEGWLFEGNDPGPHLPSIGFGPQILFQKALILRPFLAWGWRSDSPGDTRYPKLQFGISLVDPL